MITIDQLRFDRLSQSSIFERLKHQGVFFSEVITYAPYTVASMHAVFSGMYGYKNGVNSYYAAHNFDGDNCYTLPQYLKSAGYFTRADVVSSIIIPHQGVDMVTVHDEFREDLLLRHRGILRETVGHSPFFLFLHYSHIHTDMVKRVMKKYDDFDEEYFSNMAVNSAKYNESVGRAGAYLTQLLQECMDLGLENNTLFVVLTDHGCSVGEKKGERCYGVFTYEYTIRCFSYFIYPLFLPKGREIDNVVRTIDIIPTILDILDIHPRRGFRPLQGESLLGLIFSRENRDRDAFVETGGLGGPHPSPYVPNIKCLRTKEWKLIYNTTTNTRELYHLVHDRKETHNLWGQLPKVQEDLWLRMQAHLHND